MAGAGTEIASGSMPSMISALTNWPGHRPSLALPMRALAVTVPVSGSTVFSRKAMAPDCLRLSSTMAYDLDVALGHRGAQISGRKTCGTAKAT